MTERVWIKQRQPYSWRRGSGPWNRGESVLYCRYLVPERFHSEAMEAAHPDAEFMVLLAFNEDQKPGFEPPADLVCDYEPSGKLYL